MKHLPPDQDNQEATMARTITETQEDLNSIEVTRDAKGAYKYTIKIYFSDDAADLDRTVDALEKTMADLRGRFEPAVEKDAA